MPAQRQNDLTRQLAFLCSADAHHGDPGPIELIETSLSWIVLSPTRALKLKKPLKTAWQDYSTVVGRERNCREEVRVNRRLAPDVYLGMLALQIDSGGGYRLVPQSEAGIGGEIVDWLIQMRRLPTDRMLDRMITLGTVAPADIDRLAEVLANFYRCARRSCLSGDQYIARFAMEHERNKAVLLNPRLGLEDAEGLLGRFETALGQQQAALHARAKDGCLVDGQGDLRPEHICLLPTPVVIDALEFSDALRQVDPADELAYLSLECALLDAAWIGEQVRAYTLAALKDAPPPALLSFYTASRALLRARLCSAHMLHGDGRLETKWAPLTRCYLAHARQALSACQRRQAP